MSLVILKDCFENAIASEQVYAWSDFFQQKQNISLNYAVKEHTLCIFAVFVSILLSFETGLLVKLFTFMAAKIKRVVMSFVTIIIE